MQVQHPTTANAGKNFLVRRQACVTLILTF
jgi:hypothetical protein